MKEETDEGEEKGVARRRRDDDDDGDADEHDDDERDDGNSTLVEGEVIEVRCDGDGHPAPVEAGFFLAPRAERNGRPIYASGPPLSPQTPSWAPSKVSPSTRCCCQCRRGC